MDQAAKKDWIGAAKFCLYTTVASIVYGIVHDMVTAHVSIDYFTVHHPHVVDSESPVVMALVWGIIATWWVGLPGGALLAAVNTFGKKPSLPWGPLRIRTAKALAILWFLAMSVLGAIYAIASLAPKEKVGPTFEHDRRLMAVAITHGFSYLGAAIMIVGLALWLAVDRFGLGPTHPAPGQR